MSNFAEYLLERTNREIIEDDRGFATYYYADDLGCHIEDIYVRPDFRNSGVAKEYADKITDRAKERGCKFLYGSIVFPGHGKTASAKVLLAYGFKLHSATNNFILFKKEIA